MKYIYGKRDAPDGAGLFIGLLNKDNSIDKNLTRFVMRLADSTCYTIIVNEIGVAKIEKKV